MEAWNPNHWTAGEAESHTFPFKSQNLKEKLNKLLFTLFVLLIRSSHLVIKNEVHQRIQDDGNQDFQYLFYSNSHSEV